MGSNVPQKNQGGDEGSQELRCLCFQTVRTSVKKTGSVRVLQEGVGDIELEVFAQHPSNGGFDSAVQEVPETEYKFRSSEHVRKS